MSTSTEKKRRRPQQDTILETAEGVWFLVLPYRLETVERNERQDFRRKTHSSGQLSLLDPGGGRWVVSGRFQAPAVLACVVVGRLPLVANRPTVNYNLVLPLGCWASVITGLLPLCHVLWTFSSGLMNSVPMHVREKIFKHLNENCKEELEAINKQYPFEPLKVKHSCLFYTVFIMMQSSGFVAQANELKYANHSCSIWIKPWSSLMRKEFKCWRYKL